MKLSFTASGESKNKGLTQVWIFEVFQIEEYNMIIMSKALVTSTTLLNYPPNYLRIKMTNHVKAHFLISIEAFTILLHQSNLHPGSYFPLCTP